MTEPRDDSLDRLLRQTLRRNPDAGLTPSCLDAETMAAWLDGGLSGAALAAAEAHAATCPRCRALAAVMVRSATAEPRAAEVLSAATEGPRARNWLPWLVPLAAAALVAMAIWIPRRAQPPAQESTIALAPPAETSPQVPVSGAIGERRQTPPQQEAQAATKETGSKAESARPDQAEFRREAARAPAPPAATRPPSSISAPPPPPPSPPPAPARMPPPSPAPSAPPETPPQPSAAARVTGAEPVVTLAPNAGAPRTLLQAGPETVLAEFQSPNIVAQPAPIGAVADRAAADAGRGTGAAAAGGAAAGGRGGVGRGGAAPGAALAETIAASGPPPTRWRVLASGIVQRSNPPGAPWEPVAIAPAGARVTSGAAPSPLVCWLVGRNGLVFLTIDGRSFTRIMFPETVDLASVRATSARGATVTTTDGRTFVTTDGGQTWSRT